MRRRAWCSSKFRTRATPNATAALNATNAPFVTILKKNRWYYVTPRGETKYERRIGIRGR